ncbi:hypothetical protein ACWDX6_03170 [Streptomyces sp. NPDC003027]
MWAGVSWSGRAEPPYRVGGGGAGAGPVVVRARWWRRAVAVVVRGEAVARVRGGGAGR